MSSDDVTDDSSGYESLDDEVRPEEKTARHGGAGGPTF